MIYDAFGNKVNDDSTPINYPLEGAFIDSGNSINNFSTGGIMKGTVTLNGIQNMVDVSGNIVIQFDTNG